MSDASTILPSARARTNFVIFSLAFHSALIAALCVFGDDANSLHSSALAWSFATWITTFGAFVFGIAWDNSIAAKKASG